MRRKLYGTNKLVDDFTKSLIETETLDGGWTKIYTDEKTNEKWMRYVIDLERGYFWNLMLIAPKPNTEELINIALNSEFDDEIHASAARLMLNEKISQIDYRKKLIEKLEEFDIHRLYKSEKTRFRTIIESSELNSEWNRREILGKKMTEVNEDAEFFKDIANRANRILRTI
jgi:hypothetical protein